MATTKSAKRSTRHSRTANHKPVGKKWVRNVKTVSTFPPKSIFTKDAKTIAKAMESKKVSPKGLGSGIRMIQYFINRAGKALSATRRRELENAKRLLQKKNEAEKNEAQRLSSASSRSKNRSTRS